MAAQQDLDPPVLCASGRIIRAISVFVGRDRAGAAVPPGDQVPLIINSVRFQPVGHGARAFFGQRKIGGGRFGCVGVPKNDDFPRLRRDFELPPGVVSVKYTIDLANLAFLGLDEASEIIKRANPGHRM